MVPEELVFTRTEIGWNATAVERDQQLAARVDVLLAQRPFDVLGHYLGLRVHLLRWGRLHPTSSLARQSGRS